MKKIYKTTKEGPQDGNCKRAENRGESQQVGFQERAFILRSEATREWDVDVGKKITGKTFNKKIPDEKLNILNSAVIISVTNISKGWEWMLDRTSKVVDIKGELGLRTMGHERAILTTKDGEARQYLLDLEALGEENAQICLLNELWHSNFGTRMTYKGINLGQHYRIALPSMVLG